MAYEVIQGENIFEILKPFDPAHIGTIGNDIDIAGSDIDIICSTEDFSAVSAVLTEAFGDREGFSAQARNQRGVDALVVNIPARIAIEVYAEHGLTNSQLGYRHYLIATRILDIFGEEAHEEIRALKRGGLKTEPAFAAFLGLGGDDPYLSILKVEELSDAAIQLLRASLRSL